MTKLLSLVGATLLSATQCNAFVAPGPTRSSDVRLNAKLEGREIEGVLKPTTNFLLIKVADIEDQTEGGILLTGTAKIKKTEGTVVSVGPGKTHPESGLFVPMPVAAGDGVVYGTYDGTEVDYEGARHTLIRDDDILVTFSGDKLSLESADVVNDHVLVKVDENQGETVSGLVLSANAKKEGRASTGQVVKVGAGKMASDGEILKMDISEGVMVKFRDFAGNEVDIEGGEYSVVKMADIVAQY